MRLSVLGATGPSGLDFVQHALDSGHEVVAIVRNPDKLTIQHDKLQIKKGDIFDADDLATHFTSSDAVVSCLGSEYKQFSQVTLYSESVKAIVSAMEKANIRRFVFLASWFVEDRNDHPWFARIVVKPFLRQFLADMRRMEQYLVNDCPNVDYTSVRPPSLSKGELDGREAIIEPNVDNLPNVTMAMPRKDLARVVLKIVVEGLHLRTCVSVGMPLNK